MRNLSIRVKESSKVCNLNVNKLSPGLHTYTRTILDNYLWYNILSRYRQYKSPSRAYYSTPGRLCPSRMAGLVRLVGSLSQELERARKHRKADSAEREASFVEHEVDTGGGDKVLIRLGTVLICTIN